MTVRQPYPTMSTIAERISVIICRLHLSQPRRADPVLTYVSQALMQLAIELDALRQEIHQEKTPGGDSSGE